MKIVIAGAGEVGSHLAKMLSNESNEITVIDADSERLEYLNANADIITVLTMDLISGESLESAAVTDVDSSAIK